MIGMLILLIQRDSVFLREAKWQIKAHRKADYFSFFSILSVCKKTNSLSKMEDMTEVKEGKIMC